MTDRQRAFLKERGIGGVEWDEIRTAIGASVERAHTRLRVVAFARWRRKYPRGAVSEFKVAWDMRGEPVASVSWFFDIDEATARARINDARSVGNDEEEAKLAADLDVTTLEWQEAREQLGHGRQSDGWQVLWLLPLHDTFVLRRMQSDRL